MSSYGIVPGDLDRLLSPNRRIELTDSETAPTGTENTTVTQATIDKAETKFHQAAGVYYAIPIAALATATSFEVTELANMVKRVVVEIAAYDLMSRKPEFLEHSEQGYFWSQLNKQNNVFLAGLQADARPVKLPAAKQRDVPTVSTGGAKVISFDSPFSADTMKEF